MAAKEKMAEEGPGWHANFSSRFTMQSKEVSHQRLIYCMCVFAAAAECFNTVVMPNHGIAGYDLTGTTCNLFGALLGGIALRLCELGIKSSTVSNVFRGGFISCFTSFCFMVEESAKLQCGRSLYALRYFLACMLLGPCFFGLGTRIGGQLLEMLQYLKHEKSHSEETVRAVLLRARYVMTSWVVVALAIEGQLRGLDSACELAVGVVCSMAAVVVGDICGVLAEVVMDSESDVNWGTIFANVAALLVLSITRLVTPLTPNAGWFFAVFASKLCGSFCGTLSGFGAFSEDVAGELAKSKVETAAANMGMNMLVAIIFMAVLQYAECGVA